MVSKKLLTASDSLICLRIIVMTIELGRSIALPKKFLSRCINDVIELRNCYTFPKSRHFC